MDCSIKTKDIVLKKRSEGWGSCSVVTTIISWTSHIVPFYNYPHLLRLSLSLSLSHITANASPHTQLFSRDVFDAFVPPFWQSAGTSILWNDVQLCVEPTTSTGMSVRHDRKRQSRISTTVRLWEMWHGMQWGDCNAPAPAWMSRLSALGWCRIHLETLLYASFIASSAMHDDARIGIAQGPLICFS